MIIHQKALLHKQVNAKIEIYGDYAAGINDQLEPSQEHIPSADREAYRETRKGM